MINDSVSRYSRITIFFPNMSIHFPRWEYTCLISQKTISVIFHKISQTTTQRIEKYKKSRPLCSLSVQEPFWCPRKTTSAVMPVALVSMKWLYISNDLSIEYVPHNFGWNHVNEVGLYDIIQTAWKFSFMSLQHFRSRQLLIFKEDSTSSKSRGYCAVSVPVSKWFLCGIILCIHRGCKRHRTDT